jgi:hypothetical protein
MNLPLNQKKAAQMSLKEYERGIRRRIWQRRLNTAFETIGAIVTVVLAAALFAAMVYLTPEQMSAECDALTEEYNK